MKNKIKDVTCISNFIEKEFSNLNSKSSYFSNYSKLIDYLNNNNFVITEEEASKIVNDSYILVKTLDEVYNIINVDVFNDKDAFMMIFEAYNKKGLSELANGNFKLDPTIEECVQYGNKKRSFNPLKQYYADVDSIPLLSCEEETELFKRLNAGDESVREKLISSNLRLVIYVAKYFGDTGLSFEDLIQEGNLGLMKAVDKFDLNRGNKFSTFAIWWIRAFISRAIANKSRNIRIPVYLHEKMVRVKSYISNYMKENGATPSFNEISDACNIGLKEVEEMLKIDETISLYSHINDMNEFCLFDIIEDRNVQNYTDSTFNKMFLEEFERISKTDLSERERDIIILRFGFYGNRIHTLNDLALKYGISKERIRQIEEATVKKLSTKLKKFRPDDYEVLFCGKSKTLKPFKSGEITKLLKK